MSTDRAAGAAFVAAYGQTWEAWDVPGFVELFSDDVVYVAHATEQAVVGSNALASYVQEEAAEQGDVSVRMGSPLIDGNRVAAEFWVTATTDGETSTIVGCFVARLADDGRCERFREYWFDVEGHLSPSEGWGD